MKQGIYSIYDRVAEDSGPVWPAKNDAVAIRNARIMLKEVRADEFRLYCVGSWDSEAVALEPCEKREVVLPEVVEPTAGTAVHGVRMSRGGDRENRERS